MLKEPLVLRNFLLSSESVLKAELYADAMAVYANAPVTYSEVCLGSNCL